MSKIPTQSTNPYRHFETPEVRSFYGTYRSKFGPSYTIEPNFRGVSASQLAKYTPMAATFAAATGIFAVFFFAEVPRVRIDIVEKIPVIGSYFKKEIPPEDNPF